MISFSILPPHLLLTPLIVTEYCSPNLNSPPTKILRSRDFNDMARTGSIETSPLISCPFFNLCENLISRPGFCPLSNFITSVTLNFFNASSLIFFTTFSVIPVPALLILRAKFSPLFFLMIVFEVNTNFLPELFSLQSNGISPD